MCILLILRWSTSFLIRGFPWRSGENCSLRAQYSAHITTYQPAGEAATSLAPAELLDGVAERSGIVLDSSVARHDGDERWRLAQLLRRGQMDSVERANGFHRERAADASEHRLCHADQITATREDLEATDGGASLRLTEASGVAPADNGAGRLCECERGGDPSTDGAYRRPGGRIMLQEGSEQRARFDVARGQQDGGRHAHGRSTATARAAMLRPTLRHGRSRSGLPSYPPEA